MDGQWQPVTTIAFSIEGKRDGATTVATVGCALASGERLELELEFHYDPTPELHADSWPLGSGSGGDVRAESAQFAGGQGEGPSVGGSFVLEAANGASSYRVKLPLTQVASARWQPD